MDFYFGVDLLHHLQRHYEQRLSLALSKSFNQVDSRYYWLFKELGVSCDNAPKASGHDIRFAGLHVPADGGASLCDGSQFDILLVF